jgi:hypothetical protein
LAWPKRNKNPRLDFFFSRLAGSKARKTTNKINSLVLPDIDFSFLVQLISLFQNIFPVLRTVFCFRWFFCAFSTKRNQALITAKLYGGSAFCQTTLIPNKYAIKNRTGHLSIQNQNRISEFVCFMILPCKSVENRMVGKVLILTE